MYPGPGVQTENTHHLEERVYVHVLVTTPIIFKPYLYRGIMIPTLGLGCTEHPRVPMKDQRGHKICGREAGIRWSSRVLHIPSRPTAVYYVGKIVLTKPHTTVCHSFRHIKKAQILITCKKYTTTPRPRHARLHTSSQLLSAYQSSSSSHKSFASRIRKPAWWCAMRDVLCCVL